MSLPNILDYSKLKPQGIEASQKLTRFYPTTNLPNTDIVRFLINSNGFWDPMSSYLQIKVRPKATSATPFPADGSDGVYASQLDNSAASFIHTFQVMCNGVEIERVDYYEILASMLNDVFYSKEQRKQHSHEGFGHGDDYNLSYDYVTPICSLKVDPENEISLNDNDPLVNPAHLNFKSDGGTGEPVLRASTYSNHNSTAYKELTFCIPVLSSLWGILIPPEEIKYIPMFLFPNLEFNFRLNPYAMFNLSLLGGYAVRNFEIFEMELYANIIYFDSSVNDAVLDLANSGKLFFHSNSFYYGPMFNIIANGSLTASYQINMSFKSLKALFWCFIPNNYRSNTYSRQINRKALSVTSAQVRLGSELYPNFPIIGNSAYTSTNAPFLINLYKALGRLHDTANDSLINQNTFICGNTMTEEEKIGITENYNKLMEWKNGYVPGQVTFPFLAGTTFNGSANVFAFSRNNRLTNSLVGRAVYGIDLDTITSDESVISGLNSMKNKPFELILEGTNPINNNMEMHIFLYYDYVIDIKGVGMFDILGRN